MNPWKRNLNVEPKVLSEAIEQTITPPRRNWWDRAMKMLRLRNIAGAIVLAAMLSLSLTSAGPFKSGHHDAEGCGTYPVIELADYGDGNIVVADWPLQQCQWIVFAPWWECYWPAEQDGVVTWPVHWVPPSYPCVDSGVGGGGGSSW